ncbi:erythromycin esterase family protein [Streptomyces sp. ISL-98]|uniref:erythromycin esterase family protein n=1 Tax=Streptomyces sp. ISL-98 TaxID=2819192 RepID=UPI001BEBE4A9|nr:erythromycin esterase family protein [Streptomyces sp. ISL-98]MBT2508100.1 erythromycin esterase family protein [Streptomyces sp. ISL-98]
MTTNKPSTHQRTRTLDRRSLLRTAAITIAATTATTTATATASTHATPTPLQALSRHAHPLTDLNHLSRMIGGARVVGLGEAGHSAHEFFTLKHRVFGHLVATKGFTTFALEASWSTGLRLDDYVVHGTGDPEQIMSEEFQGQYMFWDTEEYLDLIRWMRHYNTAHPTRPTLRFIGNDLGYSGRDVFDRVAAYLTAHRPDLAPRITALHADLKPGVGTQAGEWMQRQLTKDLTLRRADADRARRALTLLREQGHPKNRNHHTERAYAETLQHATAITQSFTAYAFPDEQFPERMRYRDKAMAANTAWWLDHTNDGGKILLASNNGHVAYTSDNPAQFPEPTGAHLRERLGRRYVSIGLTFNQGAINALPDYTAQHPKTYEVPPAPAGHNEHTLDQVRPGGHADYALDLRTAPPAARDWLATPRPTRSYGLYWSPDAPETALTSSYDILIHLHETEAAHLR